MVSKDDFRSAMGRFATGVTVVTTLDEAGEIHGMTANSFTSVCLEPPAILVCVAHNAHTYNYVESKGTFGVNVLGVDQIHVGQYFARRPEDRTEEIDWSYSTSGDGVPLLDGSMVSMACRVLGSHVYGDHTIYVGCVEEMILGETAAPLLFYESRWNTNVEASVD